MKIVHTSDFHLDRVTMGVSRFKEIAIAVEDTVKLAEEVEADVYLFTGDLCDPNIGSIAFRITEFLLKMVIRLSRAGIESHWVAGNHDVIEDGSGYTTLSPLRALVETGLPVVDGRIFLHEQPWKHVKIKNTDIDEREEINFIFLPYVATSHNYDPADMVTRFYDRKRKNVVVGHLSIPGIIPGEESAELARGRDMTFPLETLKGMDPPPALMLNGHYHRTQVFEGIHIPGSLARLTANEETHLPAYFLLDV